MENCIGVFVWGLDVCAHHEPPIKHTPPTTRWTQTSSPHTNTPIQFSIDHIDKHLYNTVYGHYTGTSCCVILYSAENHMLQLNIICSWWWVYVPETCRATNTLINLPCCIKLAFHIILLCLRLISCIWSQYSSSTCQWMSWVFSIFSRDHFRLNFESHWIACVLPTLCSPTATFNASKVSVRFLLIIR